MKKLLLILLFPIVCFGQEDIERYKVYNTTNIYTSLLLDSATGQIWQLQIGLSDVDQLKTKLNDIAFARYPSVQARCYFIKHISKLIKY